jgi:hypothetical protein
LKQVNESNGQLIFTEPMSTGFRVVVFLIGFFPFLAPYELLIRPRWQEVSLMLIFPVIISLGASTIGIIFILAGILGLSQTLCFDTFSKSVFYTYETAITPVRRKHYNFSDIVKIEITTTDWDSKPPTYGLRIIFADGRRVEIGDFSGQHEAQEYINRIQNFLQ